MKKEYQTPATEVIQLAVNGHLLITMSNTETETQLSREFEMDPEALGL